MWYICGVLNIALLTLWGIGGISGVSVIVAERYLPRSGHSLPIAFNKSYFLFAVSMPLGTAAAKAIAGPYFWAFFSLLLFGLMVSAWSWRQLFISPSY